jgi:apolipoprotein N-acyltransferase
MIALICSLLTALCFYFSIGIGEQWYLAWLAPLPVLWLAFGTERAWKVFAAAWAGAALGATCLLRAYGGVLPAFVLALHIIVPSLLFALATLGARHAYRRLGAIAGMAAFAALYAAGDFLLSFNRGGGAVGTPAAAEMDAPLLIQCIALVGFSGMTFLLGWVSAGAAASLRSGKRAPLLLALGAFVANALFGYGHMQAAQGTRLRVALIEGDAAVGNIGEPDEARAQRAVDQYLGAIEPLAGQGVELIVLPENIARLEPAWRASIEEKFEAAARRTGARIVAGFNTEVGGARRNVSFAFAPDAAAVVYQKRRMVPVYESSVYAPGPGPKASAALGLEICKDMDYPGMLRADVRETHPRFWAVPAWDFDRDAWSHARVAVMRSVENGVPMARSSRHGLLTLNDAYGRVLLSVRAGDSIKVVTGDLPVGSGTGTIYDRIGDAFAWFCVSLGAALLAVGWTKKRPALP